MHVEAHVAVGGVDEHAVGAAGHLEVAVSLEFRSGLVIDDLVGAEDVVAVVDDDMPVEGEHVTDAGLVICIQLHGNSAGWLGSGSATGRIS